MVVLAIFFGGMGLSATKGTRLTGQGNRTARANALMTAFGEAIKSLPYQECATPALYQQAFDNAENALTLSQKTLVQTSGAALTVTNVTDAVGGLVCPGGSDPGVQRVHIRVLLGSRPMDGSVTKRDPNSRPVPIIADFTGQQQLPGPPLNPDPWTTWIFTPSITVPNPPVPRVEWWCDTGAWADPDVPEGLPDTDIQDPGGAGAVTDVVCRYATPTDPDVVDKYVAMRVTDRNGTTKLVRKPFRLANNPVGRAGPFALIAIGSAPDCTNGNPCATNTPISLLSAGPDPVDGTIEVWDWNFGDGTPTVTCYVTTIPSCKDQVHVYEGGGAFSVVLTVTDNFGATDSDTRVVWINAPVLVKPTAVITATPTCCVAPTRVRFDGRQSHADGVLPGAGTPPGGITNYSWNFGDGSPSQSGASLTQPSHDYNGFGRFTARLTVTSTNGTTNYATIPIDMSSQLSSGLPPQPMAAPTNFWNSGARKGDLPLIRDAYFDFQWVTVPRNPSPYDTIQYEIVLGATWGFCGTLGVDTNGRVFTANDPGTAGVTMNFRADFGPHPWWQRGFNGVCATDDITARIRTKRTNELGTFYSPWSAPITIDPQFF